MEIGLRGGWTELQDIPLQIPRIQLPPHLRSSSLSPNSNSPTQNSPMDPEHTNSSSTLLPPSQIDVNHHTNGDVHVDAKSGSSSSTS